MKNWHSYVFFAGHRIEHRSSTAGIFYSFSDQLDTSRVVVASGQTAPCYDADFYPFGGERAYSGTCGLNYKFTGKERDTESNVDNFGARYDSPALGRFMSVDWSARPADVPYADLDDPQSLNLYTYVRNNPLSRIDDDGHGPVDDFINWIKSLFGGKKVKPESAPPQQEQPSWWEVFKAYTRTSDPDLKYYYGRWLLGIRTVSVPMPFVQNTTSPPNGIPIPINVLNVLDFIERLGQPPAGLEGGQTFENDGRGGRRGLAQNRREWESNKIPGMGRKSFWRWATRRATNCHGQRQERILHR